MAFCEFCGKKLEDGQVCNCKADTAIPQPTPVAASAQPQPQATTEKKENPFGLAFKHIANTFKNPFGEAEDFYANGKKSTALVTIGIFAVLYLVSSVLYYVIGLFQRMISYYKIYSVLTDFTEPVKEVGRFFMSFGFPIIYMIITGGAVFGLAILINKVIYKKSLNINKIINFIAAVIVPIMAAMVMILIRKIISVSGINYTILAAVQIIALAITFIQGTTILRKEAPNDKKFLLAIVIGITGLIVVDYVMGFGFFTKLGWGGYTFRIPSLV